MDARLSESDEFFPGNFSLQTSYANLDLYHAEERSSWKEYTAKDNA